MADSTSFEELKIEVQHAEEEKNKTYELYVKQKQHFIELQKKLQSICVHDFKIDLLDNLDGPVYRCYKCGF